MVSIHDKLITTKGFMQALEVLHAEKPKHKIITKALEELSELQTVLLQFLNKPEKVDIEEIGVEIVDVQQHLMLLPEIFKFEVDYNKVVDKQVTKFLNSNSYKNYEKKYNEKASR